VIAHEVGHHVQHLEGTEQEVRRLSEQQPGRANELSIRLELQADCYAGFWGRAANTIGALSPGDLEEGLNAAAAIGDDRIQESVNGRVNPESWTHGSSEQRQRWLRTGFQVGNPDACDTFGVPFGDL
jgi:predicted metalloprotease